MRFIRALQGRPNQNQDVRFHPLAELDHLAHYMTAVRREGTNLLGPTPLLTRLSPFLAEQHVGTVDLVDRKVVCLTATVEDLALAADIKGGGLGLETCHRAHA